MAKDFFVRRRRFDTGVLDRRRWDGADAPYERFAAGKTSAQGGVCQWHTSTAGRAEGGTRNSLPPSIKIKKGPPQKRPLLLWGNNCKKPFFLCPYKKKRLFA